MSITRAVSQVFCIKNSVRRINDMAHILLANKNWARLKRSHRMPYCIRQSAGKYIIDYPHRNWLHFDWGTLVQSDYATISFIHAFDSNTSAVWNQIGTTGELCEFLLCVPTTYTSSTHAVPLPTSVAGASHRQISNRIHSAKFDNLGIYQSIKWYKWPNWRCLILLVPCLIPFTHACYANWIHAHKRTRTHTYSRILKMW